MTPPPADSFVSLSFPLDVDDDWPPVSVECLSFRVVHGGYQAMSPPLFVKDLSVDDVIEVTTDPTSGAVRAWKHVTKSDRTTIWLLRMSPSVSLPSVLEQLRQLGCNTTSSEALGVHSIDVPSSLSMEAIDKTLTRLEDKAVAVAFPSLRHADDGAS